MRASFAKSNVCGLCYSATPQNKVIFASLVRQLKKLALIVTFSQKLRGLARLLFALNLTKRPEKTYQQTCKHHFWLKRIKKYLGCTLYKLDYLCHLTANIISQKSYHFFLLEAQIKNIIDTSSQIATEIHPIKQEQAQENYNNVFESKKCAEVGKNYVEVQARKCQVHRSFSTIQENNSLASEEKGLQSQLKQQRDDRL